MPLIVKGLIIETDSQGYLSNTADWNKEVALAIAENEKLQLTASHWEVIYFVRNFYQQFNKSPAMRPLVNYLTSQLGEEKSSSMTLALLFPGGAAKQSTKLAGLPKPARCI